MNDDQLPRYSRHILLPQIGSRDRSIVRSPRWSAPAALGSPAAAATLASAGIGTLALADGDSVDLAICAPDPASDRLDWQWAKVDSGRRTASTN